MIQCASVKLKVVGQTFLSAVGEAHLRGLADRNVCPTKCSINSTTCISETKIAANRLSLEPLLRFSLRP